MLQKYKIPITITVFIFTLLIIYKVSTTRRFIYSVLVEVIVPKRIKNVPCDSSISANDYLILDARSLEEFQVSHLPNAVWIGDDSLAVQRANFDVGKREPHYLIYCSIGYRSQLIGKQLQDSLGFAIVNLTGGIFSWNQNGFPLEDSLNNATKNVAPYSFFWGLWRV